MSVRLTDFQLDVLAGVALGANRVRLAARLGSTRDSVDMTLATVRTKLGVTTTQEAIARARQLGLLR